MLYICKTTNLINLKYFAMKLGDKVRFVSEVGGGVISGFQGNKVVLVEDEDGFEIPVLRSEVVVIDEEKEQKAMPKPDTKEPKNADCEFEPCDRPITFHAKPVERAGGNVLNVLLAFVPGEQHESLFDLYMVNDSNYQLQVQLLRQQSINCNLVWADTLQPNTKKRVCEIDINEVGAWEHLGVQLLASKVDRAFMQKPAYSVDVRMQPMKFYKESTFQHTPFFIKPAWLIDVVRNDVGQ